MGGLLLYYTLGSDPALWPAGERRERGLITHDKGYYHSYLEEALHAQQPGTRACDAQKHQDPGKHQDFVPLLLGPLNPSLSSGKAGQWRHEAAENRWLIQPVWPVVVPQARIFQMKSSSSLPY